MTGDGDGRGGPPPGLVDVRGVRRSTPPGERRARWRVRLKVVGSVGRLLLGIGLLAMIPLALVLGPRAEAADQHLIDTAPRVEATVVAVRPDLRSTAIVVDVDGRTPELALGYPGDQSAREGDTLEVVVSPDDPDHVISVHAHDGWEYTRAGGIVIVGGACVLGLVVGIGSLVVPGLSGLVEVRRGRRSRRPRLPVPG